MKKILIFLIFLNLIRPNISRAVSSGVVIGEVAYEIGGIADKEFITLFNTTDKDIDLSGYSLKKKNSSGTESSLVSSIKFSGKIPAYGFFLIANAKYEDALAADLVFSGASYYLSSDNTVLLYDKNNTLIDKVGYGGAADFEGSAALDPGAGKSIARKFLNKIIQDTDNNKDDFEIQNSPEPKNSQAEKIITDTVIIIAPPADSNQGASSSLEILPEALKSEPQGSAINIEKITRYHLGDAVINEFVSDPTDGEREWIELYNNGGDIDLSGWTVEDGSGAKTNLSGKLSADNRFKVIEDPKGNLNNSGDMIILRDSYGTLIDKVVYGTWVDGDQKSNAPVGSDPLSTARRFDGNNTYNNSNDFALTKNLTRGFSNIIIEAEENVPSFGTSSNNIILNEIFSNPRGDDSVGEFFEIFNGGDEEVNLFGWAVENENGKRFEIISTTTIKAKGYQVFYRKDSGLALGNDGGKLKLFKPGQQKIFQSVTYKEAAEEYSYSQKDGKWIFSETATPGRENVIKVKNKSPEVVFYLPKEIFEGMPVYFDTSDTYDEEDDRLTFVWDFGDGTKSNFENPEHVFLSPGKFTVKLVVSDGVNEIKKEKVINVKSDKEEDQFLSAIINDVAGEENGVDEIIGSEKRQVGVNKKSKTATQGVKIKHYIQTTLEEVKNFEKGSLVVLSGTVAVKPGIYGSQYFYIVGSPGLQIYNYKKDFPVLRLGDYVEVKGEISEINGEQRLKIFQKEDIRVVRHEAGPLPSILSCDDLSSDYAGRLVKVSGEVTDKKGQTIYIDDGSGEAIVYLKKNSGLNASMFKTGMNVVVSGLALSYKNSIQILPRFLEDIEIKPVAAEVIGDISTSTDWVISGGERNNLKKYAIISGLGGLSIFGYLIWSFYKKKSSCG